MLNKSEERAVNKAIKIIENALTEKGECFNASHLVKNYCCLQLQGLEHEVFSVIFLDSQHRLIKYIELFSGTVNGCSVYSREVVKAALEYNSAAVIFCHNHPSGLPDPSGSDVKITERLTKALELIDVRVLDHIVVGGVDTVSFAETGLI